MNAQNDLYILSPEKIAEIRAEQHAEPFAEMQSGARLAPRLTEAGKSRSPFADPALYLTVSVAAVVVALLDMAVRMQ